MNLLKLKEIPIKFQPKPHRHLMLINNSWVSVPGVTTVAGLFGEDSWKFAWPVKLMEEYMWEHFVIADIKDLSIDDAETLYEKALKEARGAWRSKRDKSADSGTRAHEIISTYINTGVVESFLEDKEVENCVENFLAWEKEVKPKWLASEVQVGSMTHRYCGILDAVAEIEGKNVLVDLKTGKDIFVKEMDGSQHIKESMAAQLAGLSLALEEQGLKLDARGILHLPKEGRAGFTKLETDLERDKEDFINAVRFLRSKNLMTARCKAEAL